MSDGRATAHPNTPATPSEWLNRIHVGDCVQLLRRWAGKYTVDMVFADPPYNIGYDYDLYDDARPDQEYLDWLREWIDASARLLADHGSLWIAIGDEYAAEVKWIATRKLKLVLRNWVVWYYTFGVHCQSKFTRSHTHLLHFVKNPERALFRAEAVRVPSARRLIYHDLRADPKGRVPDNTWILRPQEIPWAFRADEDTWYIPRVAGTFSERAGFHGCQLPERLVARAILACTEENQIVLDPFAGSGTTLAVAQKLGRRWVGIELSPNYAEHAEQRVRSVRAGDPLEGPDEGVLPVQRRGSIVRRQPLLDSRPAVTDLISKAVREHPPEAWLTDPVLNARFLEDCRRAGVPGQPFDWNNTLMEQCLSQPAEPSELLAAEPCTLAADLAAGRLLSQGYPDLRTLLCEPRVSCLYDEVSQNLKPRCTAGQLRRELLTIVKLARWAAAHAESVDCPQFAFEPLHALSAVPDQPGILAIGSRNKRRREILWYAGFARSLATCVAWCREVAPVLQTMAPVPGELIVGWKALSGLSARDQLRYLTAVLTTKRPSLSAMCREMLCTQA